MRREDHVRLHEHVAVTFARCTRAFGFAQFDVSRCARGACLPESRCLANVPHAKLQRRGLRAEAARRGACHVRAANPRRERYAGGLPPSKLSLHEGLQPRPEAGRCQLQREVSPPIVFSSRASSSPQP